jgi:L-threonine kinase
VTSEDGWGTSSKFSRVGVPCTCGELFQGALDGRLCLVSCPINIYSTARVVEPTPAPLENVRRKVDQALEWLAERTGRRVAVEVSNPLPSGRGYGTSTADIGAALFAAGRALNYELTPAEASQAAVRIEPTDSSLLPGLTLFDHRAGRFQEFLGETPSARLFVLDPGGTIDTEAFNARDWRDALARIAPEQQCAYQILKQGVASGDLAAIGEAATLSARAHQTILYNPWVYTAQSLGKELGAVGICRAHSGTIVGLIFPIDTDCRAVVHFLAQKLPGIGHVRQALLTGGGPVFRTPAGSQEAQQ